MHTRTRPRVALLASGPHGLRKAGPCVTVNPFVCPKWRPVDAQGQLRGLRSHPKKKKTLGTLQRCTSHREKRSALALDNSHWYCMSVQTSGGVRREQGFVLLSGLVQVFGSLPRLAMYSSLWSSTRQRYSTIVYPNKQPA